MICFKYEKNEYSIEDQMDPYLECGRTALQEAIYIGDYENAKRLIYNGANVRQSTKLGTTSLHLACQNHTYDEILVELLLAGGCPRDSNALDAACSNGYLPLVRVLHKFGVQLQERNGAGWNGFTYAAENGHPQVIYFLLHNYCISEYVKSRISFMKLCLNGDRKLLDAYISVTESMICFPRNIERHKAIIPYIICFREVRERVRAWFQVAIRIRIPKDISRLIGLHLWNTRFECIKNE